jgi:hypothetical protein
VPLFLGPVPQRCSDTQEDERTPRAAGEALAPGAGETPCGLGVAGVLPEKVVELGSGLGLWVLEAGVRADGLVL